MSTNLHKNAGSQNEPSQNQAVQLDAILRCSADAIISLTNEWRVTSWNQAATALFGYTEAEATGAVIEDLIVPDAYLRESRDLLRANLDGSAGSVRDTVRAHKNGTLVPVKITTAPMRNAQNDIIGAIAIYRDLRSQKSAEEVRNADANRLQGIQGAFAGGGSEQQRLQEVLPETTIVNNPMVLDEPRRIAAIEATGLLDQPRQAIFEQFALLARRVLGVPMALVTLVLPDRQSFVSASGLPPSMASETGTPIDQSYCKHVVTGAAPIVINDASNNPLVQPCHLYERGLVAYLGVPIVSPTGEVLGSFCVLDDAPRQWTNGDLSTLIGIANLATQEVSNRILVRQLKEEASQKEMRETSLRESEARYRAALQAGRLASWEVDEAKQRRYWTSEGLELFGIELDNGCGQLGGDEDELIKLVHPQDRPLFESFAQLASKSDSFPARYRIIRPDGSIRWISGYGHVLRRDHEGRPVRSVHVAADVTDQVNAEFSLRESEEQFRTFFEKLAVGASEIDVETRKFRLVNDRLCAITGYTREELVGKIGPSDIVHPDDLEEDQRRFQRFLNRTDHDFVAEKRYVRKDGSIVWVRASANAIEDANGRIVRCPAVVEDITERKEAEAEAVAAQGKLATALAAAGQGVWEFDIGRDQINWDSRTYELFNLPEDESVNYDRYIEGLVHPDDREEYVQLAEEAMMPDGSGELRAEHRIFDRNGRIRWVSVLGRTHFEGIGPMKTAVRMVGTVRDVTSNKLAEEAMRASEARFSTMANNLPLMVWVHGPDGRQQFVNDTFCRYFGVTREQISGGQWKLPAHPHDAVGYSKSFAESIADQAEFHEELRVRDADGDWRWLESWAQPHFDDDGKYLGHIGASADITERKKAEEQNNLLMKEVNHRSKNLLTVVQSIARNTARGVDPGQFATNFSRRLQGLSASQDLLIDGDWTAVGLRDLVRSQLQHMGDALSTRITLSHHQVLLTPAAAQGIGMAIHELSTNAMKHGALSNDKGQISIDWSSEVVDGERVLRIIWIESDGPPVEEPTRSGFGRTVIERMAEHAVGGTVELKYEKSGLSWSLTAPEENVIYRIR